MFYICTVLVNYNSGVMIKIQNLQFAYRRQQALFKDLSVDIEAGSVVGLLGKNGAGKSTLLKLMCGLMAPHAGSIQILNENPIQRRPVFLESIVFVPEEIDLPGIKISRYIKAMARMYPNFDRNKLETILEAFDLQESMKLSKISYGQKKKFIIAFALSTQSRVLILDEPTNGLDIPSKALFRKVVAGALTDEQVVFISTHQVKDVENLIDKIVMIDQGKIVFNQSIFDISSKYAFVSSGTDRSQSALYQEEMPGGYKQIVPCVNQETAIDLEVLFNAVMKGVHFN